MENFVTVAAQVAVLFLLMGVGAVCRRRGLIDAPSVKGMVNVLLMVVTPALIVDVFQRSYDPAMLESLALAFVISVAVHAVMIALVGAAVRHRNVPSRSALRVAGVLSKAGFMGIPLEQAILGDAGVFYGVVYVVVFNLLAWSWGVRVMGGKADWRMMLVNPGTVGLAMALPIFFLSVELPPVVARPVSMLADLNTPLAMLIIGYYLAGAKLSVVLATPGAYVSAFLRLIACPLMLTAAFWPFRSMLNPEVMIALTIPASAPSAAMVTMFAAKYDGDVDLSVGVVSATTLMSMATMPVMIALAMEVLK